MSIDPSLKVRNALTRHRNVLTRAERIKILAEEERWTEEDSILGLPKVEHRKSAAGKKSKAAAERAEAAAAESPAETPADEAAESSS
jgi:small basic protein (TIGR04137 family)